MNRHPGDLAFRGQHLAVADNRVQAGSGARLRARASLQQVFRRAKSQVGEEAKPSRAPEGNQYALVGPDNSRGEPVRMVYSRNAAGLNVLKNMEIPEPVRRVASMHAFVLVVDDDPMILDLATSMLEELGCRVIASSSAHEALRVLKAEPGITALLTDIQMPRMDGVELAAEARRIRRDLHVVFASGGTRVHEEPFLAKPFTREELFRVMHG